MEERFRRDERRGDFMRTREDVIRESDAWVNVDAEIQQSLTEMRDTDKITDDQYAALHDALSWCTSQLPHMLASDTYPHEKYGVTQEEYGKSDGEYAEVAARVLREEMDKEIAKVLGK